jgi:hypothetical protein
MRTVTLATPPLPRLVPAETFDAFSWCVSDTLEWRCPGDAITLNELDDALPLGMAFVFRTAFAPLPAEFAWLHIGRAQAHALGIHDAMCLAPYALDDATDELFAHRRAPGEVFWIATDNVNALYWALHDWSHFHNHGSFDDRPATEYQCDVAALAWLWINRDAIPLPDAHWERLREASLENHHRLRAERPVTLCPPSTLLEDGAALRALADQLRA